MAKKKMSKENNQSGLTPHIFKDTGREVLIRKVSPFLIGEVRKRYPEPKPPKQMVMLGDVEVEEYNPAHPNYAIELKDYNELLMDKMMKLVIDRGVVVHLTEENKEEIKELRDWWFTEFGEPLGGSDKHVYIYHICVGTDKDVSELQAAILQRSHPTNGIVEDAMSNFPSDI